MDVYPTVVEFACGELDARERALPGESLVALAREQPAERVVFSEMHDDGSMTGEYMVRRGDWKLVHYVGFPPQLFNLAPDPFEERDLAGQPETAGIQGRLYDRPAPDRGSGRSQPARLRRSADRALGRIDRLGGVEHRHGGLALAPTSTSAPLPAS